MFRESIPLDNSDNYISLSSIFIWLSAALFTIFQLLLEMLTNVIADPLIHAFGISHAQLGFLTSTFFYAFLIMQFPAGILLDKFNIKWVLSLACTGCGLGCLLFGYSTTFIEACFDRAIMGAFATFGFLGLLKVSYIWYPRRLFPFLVGLSQFLVMITTALIEPFVFYFVENYGWRSVLIYSGYIAFIIAFFIVIFVREKLKSATSIQNKQNILYSFFLLITNKQCWFAALYGFGMFSTIAAFSALWGLSYLKNIHHIQPQEAAYYISMNFTGIAFGCALFGCLSSYLNSYLVFLRLCSLGTSILLFLLAYKSTLTPIQLKLILFLLGMLGSSYFLCFDIIKISIASEIRGIAIAFCNIFVMSSTILLQPLMGAVLDLNILAENTSIHTAYQFSIMILISTVLLAFIISNFIKTNSPVS